MSVEQQIIDDIAEVIRETLLFLKKIGRLNLLEENDYNQVSEIIYRLYNGIGSSFREHILDIIHLEINPSSKSFIDESLVRYKRSLEITEKIALKILKGKVHVGRSWIACWFRKESPTIRLYVNCSPAYVHKVVEPVLIAIKRGFFRTMLGVVMLKFYNPKKANIRWLIRTDKFVIYLNNKKAIKPLLEVLERVSGYLDEPIPKFTTKLMGGVGIASEPAAKHQEYYARFTDETTSFGGFMSMVIARYICSWVSKYGIPDDRQLKAIATDIYNYKLKRKHGMQFEF